jgi:NADH-ubiquinone oxidoreductase chain 5
MFIGSLSLMGFPFLTGFYSKDVILEAAYGTYSLSGHFAHWLGTRAAFCTAFYSFRLTYLCFFAETQAYKKSIEGAHDAPILMAFPLLLLAICAIFLGWLWRDLLIGPGTAFWGHALFTHPHHLVTMEAEFLPAAVKNVPVGFSIVGAFLGFFLYKDWGLALTRWKTTYGYNLFTFLNRRWFFDRVYNDMVRQPLLHAGHHVTYTLVDRGVIELAGPLGLARALQSQLQALRTLHTGYLYHHVFLMLLGTLGLLTLFVAPVGIVYAGGVCLVTLCLFL